MTQTVSRWVIPNGTDLTVDADVFPHLPGEDFLANKEPMFMTALYSSVSGRENRRATWSYPIWHFKVKQGFVPNPTSNSSLMKLFAFFNAHQGKYKEFFFLDPEDNVVSQNFAIGDGTTVNFQATRTVSVGGHSFTEPVRGFNAAPVVQVAGVTTAVTVQPYGSFLFATAPAAGAGISWSGSFFFLCRFDQDNLPTVQQMSRLWDQSGLAMKSIKP